MIDAQLRRITGPAFERTGARLHRLGVDATTVTAVGWILGIGACVAAGARSWPAALGLWLANRLLDGLDGAVARAAGPTARGGFLDIVADFSVYGGFVAGVAIGVPSARLACVVLLLAYYTSGTAFLALSSLLERRPIAVGPDGEGDGDGRSLRFVGGIAEGAETVTVYVALCLWPAHAAAIAWAFAAAVGVTALQRVWLGTRSLRPVAVVGERGAPAAVAGGGRARRLGGGPAAQGDPAQWDPDVGARPSTRQPTGGVDPAVPCAAEVEGPDELVGRRLVAQGQREPSTAVVDDE